MFGTAVFWIAALMALAGAIGVVATKNPVHTAISLVLTMLALGVLFLLLHAEFLAVVEVMVYAGAVMVLFLFVVTLLVAGVKPPAEQHRLRLANQTLIAGLFGLVLFALVLHAMLGAGWVAAPATGAGTFGSIASFGTALFTRYLLPFELTAIVLLVAVIGVVVLGREQE